MKRILPPAVAILGSVLAVSVYAAKQTQPIVAVEDVNDILPLEHRQTAVLTDAEGNPYLLDNGILAVPGATWNADPDDPTDEEGHVFQPALSHAPGYNPANVCGGKTTVSCTEYNTTRSCDLGGGRTGSQQCKQWYCQCLGDGGELTAGPLSCGQCVDSTIGLGIGHTLGATF